ncbi:MAG: DUF6105 family protein [Pseudomonadota bacterium]
MRWLLIAWFTPLAIFWGWLGLAYVDAWPSSVFFSRVLYDSVFVVYEQMTGLNESQLISYLAKICILDSLIVLAIYAFRRRKLIRAWWASRRAPEAAV